MCGPACETADLSSGVPTWRRAPRSGSRTQKVRRRGWRQEGTTYPRELGGRWRRCEYGGEEIRALLARRDDSFQQVRGFIWGETRGRNAKKKKKILAGTCVRERGLRRWCARVFVCAHVQRLRARRWGLPPCVRLRAESRWARDGAENLY